MSEESGSAGGRRADPLLSVSDLRAGYGDTEVLQGVSFGVDDGEVVALVGRNGAGKTTTLRSIVGTVTPRGGTVTLDGTDATRASPEDTVGRGVAFVPEDRRVFPGLTVRENLELARLGGASSAPGRPIEAVLDTFENLRENVDSRGSALSGGEQQMLAIARALVGGASVLMLDEPTEGLAPFVVRRVEDVIEDLSDDGLAVLLVEQNVTVALAVADYVYVVDRGEIVHAGTADELADDPAVLERHLGVTA